MASDPRHRWASIEQLRRTLHDEVRFGRRVGIVALSASIAAAVALIVLGVLLKETINLAALVLGYSAVCSWLAVACACALSLFGPRRPWVRLDQLEMRLRSEAELHADEQDRSRQPGAADEYRLLEELLRAIEETVEANWRPMRFAAWFAGLAAALTLAAVGSAVLPGVGSAAEQPPTDSESVLGVSWVVQEPLFIQTPQSFRLPPHGALVTLRVLDSQRPECISRYRWQVSSSGVPIPLQAPVTGNCSISIRLVPEEQYQVRVTRDEPSGGVAMGEVVVRVGNLLVASFGDSVASGEGNPASRKPRWADSSKCNRSLIAGPRQAAQLISSASAHSRVVFLHLACTGAWINGAGAPYGVHKTVLPQPEKSDSQAETFAELYPAHHGETIVLLSVGANDVGFGPIVRFCLKRISRRCFKKRLRETKLPLEELVPRRLSELRASYERLAESPPFRGSRVFVSEYFDPLHNEQGNLCRVVLGRFGLGMSVQEAAWAESGILRPLNSIVREQAAAHNWVFVDGVSNAFRDHGYCARASWIVRIIPALLAGNSTGPFHPNALGQQAYGDSIFQAVRPYLPP